MALSHAILLFLSCAIPQCFPFDDIRAWAARTLETVLKEDLNEITEYHIQHAVDTITLTWDYDIPRMRRRKNLVRTSISVTTTSAPTPAPAPGCQWRK